MKKIYFGLLTVLCVLAYSCQQDEATLSTEMAIETTSLISQATAWKTIPISKNLITNQRAISHYQFDVDALQTLIDNTSVNYVWFDLGVNDKNQITFTATGEDVNDAIVGQVVSKIVSTKTYRADFSVLNKVKDVFFGDRFNHILPNKDAYQYVTSMKDAYLNFEAILDQGGQRVERFGLNAVVVKRMLMTKNINTLGLFLGKNKKEKMTTVFIGMDTNNNLLINDSADVSIAGVAFDFTLPCPFICDL